MKKFLVLIFGVIFSLSAFVLSGCDDKYKNISLSSSVSSVRLAVGSTDSFMVNIENYFAGMSHELSVSCDGEYITVEEIDYGENGEAFITLKGIKVGRGSVMVATNEGYKVVQVGVEVYQPLTSFELKQNPYILKESGFNLNLAEQDYFTFLPNDTSKVEVSYYYAFGEENIKITSVITEEIEGELFVSLVNSDNEKITITDNEFVLKAAIDGNIDINPVDVTFAIIEPIVVGNLNVINNGLGADRYYNNEEVYSLLDGEQITLVSNSKDLCYYEYELQVETAGVSFEIQTSQTEWTKLVVNPLDYQATSVFSKFFSLQAYKLGDDELKLRVYYENFEQYTIEKSFPIKTISTPSSIYVNDKPNLAGQPITLYDQNINSEGNFEINLAVYALDSLFESVEVSFYSKTGGDYYPLLNWAQFVGLSYNGESKTTEFAIPSSHFKNNMTVTPLTLIGKKQTVEDIYLRVNVVYDLMQIGAVVDNLIPIRVLEGVTAFDVKTEYKSGIFLDVDAGMQVFNGLEYQSQTAFLGDMKFEYLGGSENIFIIEQIQSNAAPVNITPLQTGSGSVKITLANGRSTMLFVTVEKQLESATVSIVKDSHISKTQSDLNGNLQEIAVKFAEFDNQENKVVLDLKLVTNPSIATLYALNFEINEEKPGLVEFNPNDFTLTVNGTGVATLTITLTKKYIDNFKNYLLDVTQNPEAGITFNIGIISYAPVETLNVLQDGVVNNVAKMYKSADVGYYYQNQKHASAELDLEAILSSGAVVDNIFTRFSPLVNSDYKVTFSAQSGHAVTPTSTSNVGGNYVERGQIGGFGSYTITNNHLVLSCDSPFAISGSTFWLSITITQYNQSVNAVITVVIDTYKPLKDVGFLNYEKEIYLSDASPSHTFMTFVDGEADCQEYRVVFVPVAPTSESLISVAVNSDYTRATITYNGVGTGWGTLYFVPLTSFTGEETFDNGTPVVVRVSDGTDINNPLRISTPEEFISSMSSLAGLNKHYKITTILDFAGVALSPFGVFNGTIVGENAGAKLINLNINSVFVEGNNEYVGLFYKLSSSAQIKNLYIEARVNYAKETQNNVFVGTIACINDGLVENVCVELNASSVAVENYLEENVNGAVRVGGIVAVNNGVIKTVVNSETLMHNHLLLRFNETYAVSYKGYSQNTAFGGVSAVNNNTITRIEENDVVLYNSSVYSVIANLKAEGVNSVGGASGENNGTINGLLLDGRITSERYSISNTEVRGGQNVGGVTGVNNAYINDCDVRTIIHGYDYVGGIAGLDSTINTFTNSSRVEDYQFITNCSVQAVNTGKFEYMLTCTYGNETTPANIGAISGNQKENVNAVVYKPNNNNANYYYKENISKNIYPVAYGIVDGAYQYLAYIESNPNFNYFEYKQVAIEVDSVVSDLTLGAGKLEVSDSTYDNLVAYMYFYEAEDSAYQSALEEYNNNRILPFKFKYSDSIVLSSLTSDVLEINAEGRVNLKNTGLAIIQVTSVLNKELDSFYVYIYVTNAFDGFEVLTGDNLSIQQSSVFVVYDKLPMELTFNITHSDIEVYDSYMQRVDVSLITNTDASLKAEINEAEAFVDVRKVANKFVISVNHINDLDATNTITFTPYFEVNIDNIGAVNMVDLNITATPGELSIITTAMYGTEKIEANVSDLKCEPIDEINLSLQQITDNQADYLTFTSVKVGEDESGATDYFNISSVSGYYYDETSGRFLMNNYSDGASNGQFKIQFNYSKYITSDYAGLYYITFTSDNGVQKTITVEVVVQQIANVIVKNYFDIGTNFSETLSEKNYVASNATNLLSLELYPVFSDYEYLYIHNAASNAEKDNTLTFEAVEIDSDGKLKTIYGVEYVSDGVKIPKNIIESYCENLTSAKLFLRYSTTSNALVDSIATIIVDVLKKGDNGSEIAFSTYKNVSVIIKDNIKFSIVNRDNKANETIYVAKGLSYELKLDIYGFTEEQMVIQYLDKNSNRTNVVSISKQDGTYYLHIKDNIEYTTGEEGYEVNIVTYGENTVDGLYYSSGKSTLTIMIVDFVILVENINAYDYKNHDINAFYGNSVVSGVTDGRASVAIGNIMNLGVKLENGLTVEYDVKNSDIAYSVGQFEEQMSASSKWQISANDYGILGDYITKTTINNLTTLVSNYIRINGLNVSPMKIISYVDAPYYFTYSGMFIYENGVPKASTEFTPECFNLTTDFVLDVYSTGTEENSVPIYTYEDLMAMQAGGYYILMNNLTLPSDFEPIETAVASFNGNGYYISLPTVWNVEADNVGLFGFVNSGTIIKNVEIRLSKSTSIVITNNSAIYFGLIAGNNEGTITNCAVVSDMLVNLTVSITGQTEVITDNYVAGLVGYNNGYITHSRVNANIISNSNVAGLVGVNSLAVSSSYVKDTSIINKSADVLNYTAGFAIKNGTNTQDDAYIDSCYVCGEYNASAIYSQSTTKVLRSDTQVAGFVYDNYGKISNAYSDIVIISQSARAGFVFNNGGSIKNTYSTSTFGKKGQTSYGFAVKNFIENSEGTISGSYYLLGTANANVNETVISGVTPLSEAQFMQSARFSSFIIGDTLSKDEGIWFYPSRGGESLFLDDNISKVFTYGKPELVSPNIIAKSQKRLDSANVGYDEITGQTTYVYNETKNADGSKYNPYIIHDAESFENLIYNHNANNVNTKYYRVVSEIDYVAENITNSKIYKTIFKGMLEGNGMTVKGYIIDSKENLVSGGLFAKIGQGSTGDGIVKNLTLMPKYINLPNASNVGALAGSLESGKIYNINVDGFNYDQAGIVIIGYNCVGGVVGVATNSFSMINVHSAMSARASYNSSANGKNMGIYTNKNTTNVSYSGVLAGVANNYGTIKEIGISGNVASIGEIAGLMFGKIGNNITVQNIDLEVSGEQFIRATYYGGIIAGELSGTLSGVTVNGEASADLFKVNPIVPVAVGGLVGLVNNGIIYDVISSLDLMWTIQSPDIVGGIAGEMTGGRIESAYYTGDIILNSTLNYSPLLKTIAGGIVGNISYETTVDTSVITNAENTFLVECKTSNGAGGNNKITAVANSIYDVSIGGLVGQIVNSYKTFKQNNADVTMAKFQHTVNGCQSNTDINISSVIFGGVIDINAGGIVGGVFSDSTMKGAGELIIYDTENANALYGKYASNSNSTLTISVKDMKTTGIVNINFGGILGVGYPVKELAICDGTPNSYVTWAKMLSDEITQNSALVPDLISACEYAGQKDNENNIIYDWESSAYCDISNIIMAPGSNPNKIVNNYW